MSDIDKGFLIYREWLNAMKLLPASDFKRVMMAMWDYQFEGKEPPEFKGKCEVVATMVFPHIKRRLQMSAAGKRSAMLRGMGGSDGTASGGVNSLSEDDHVANAVANGVDGKGGAVVPTVAEHSRAEKSITEQILSEQSRVEGSGTGDGSLREPPEPSDARAEKKEDFVLKEGGEERVRYGKMKNVLLTEAQYVELCRIIPCADECIDHFSEKLAEKGYRYSDHFSALLTWWERDRPLFERNAGAASARSSRENQGSFNTDSFFEAAVRKSLGGA